LEESIWYLGVVFGEATDVGGKKDLSHIIVIRKPSAGDR